MNGPKQNAAWITPGVSFHRELELLVSTGISALDGRFDRMASRQI